MSIQHTLSVAVPLALALTVDSVQSASVFNPDISLILDGRYVSYDNDSEYGIPGYMLGSEAGRSEKGFQLGHNELVLSANIDDLFFGKMTTVLADHEGATEVTLEEAYIETLGLGAGATLRAGRFFSGIGYLNEQHPHSWDFADAPLIYRGLFGDQLRDDGVQVSWVAPTELFFKLGAELTRGAQFPAGGATNNGSGTYALFAKFGGDVGTSHAWQLGLSHWSADVEGRTSSVHTHGVTITAVPTFSGDSAVSGIDFVWKWAPHGNASERNLKFQFEYLMRDEEGTIIMDDGTATPQSSSYDGRQNGWYSQLVYQFMPRWRGGLRYDQLNSDNILSNPIVLTEAGLDDEGQHPRRMSLMIDYSYSEYSRLRLQYDHDQSYRDNDRIIMLQYVMSMGAHGAHTF